MSEFTTVFQQEIFGLPARRDVDLSINIIPRASLISKAACCMTLTEQEELNILVQKFLDKDYIRPSFSP